MSFHVRKRVGVLFLLLAVSLAAVSVRRYLRDEKLAPNVEAQRPSGILGQVFWTPTLTADEQRDAVLGCLSIMSLIVSASLLYRSGEAQ